MADTLIIGAVGVPGDPAYGRDRRGNRTGQFASVPAALARREYESMIFPGRAQGSVRAIDRIPPDRPAFEVTVTSGIVTVNGQADSYGLACQLIDTVRHVDGVIEVRDRVSCPAGDVPKTTGHAS